MKRTWQKPEVYLLTRGTIESGSIYIMGSEGVSMTFSASVMKGSTGTCYLLTKMTANAEMNSMNATLFVCS